MARILIVYSTTDGHTLKIGEVLRQTLEPFSHAVTLVRVEEAAALDLAAFDKIIIGASIRYGHHAPAVFDFIRTHQAMLESRPNAFFTVNIVARKPDKNTPATNPYLRKFLRRIAWQPQHLAVFAGKLDYPRYGFFDRQMIRLIMLMTHGPTAPDSVVEFTDWGNVRDFGAVIHAM
jgi:menaquinone-dependent protoporphyrinogen oxidase